MPEPTYILAAVLVSSAVTWTLRAAPFALLAPIRHSALLPYLNENMPAGIMTILVFYTVRHTPPALTPTATAVAAGLVITAGLHLWRHNAVVSVLGGTAVHVALASPWPPGPDRALTDHGGRREPRKQLRTFRAVHFEKRQRSHPDAGILVRLYPVRKKCPA